MSFETPSEEYAGSRARSALVTARNDMDDLKKELADRRAQKSTALGKKNLRTTVHSQTARTSTHPGMKRSRVAHSMASSIVAHSMM